MRETDWIGVRYSAFLRSFDKSADCPKFSSISKDSGDFTIPSSLILSVARIISNTLERGISLELPSHRVCFAVVYQNPLSFMLGRLRLGDGSLEALYSTRWGQWIMSAATCINKPSILPQGSQMRLSIEKATDLHNISYSFSNVGSTFGLQYLRKLSRSLGLGSEIYYTCAENSGGISVGAKWSMFGPLVSMSGGEASNLHIAIPPTTRPMQQDVPPGLWSIDSAVEESKAPMTGTVLLNPIMGHVQIACFSPIFYPQMFCSLRYDLNLYSFDADLAAGLLYRPHVGQLVKIRASWKHGLALCLRSILSDTVKFEVGIATGPFKKRTSGIDSIPRRIAPMSPTLGLELSIET